jgi:hypothetical protein
LSARSEVDLEVEAPALHVGVERIQVGVVDDRLVVGEPTQLGGQPVRELGFAHADVPGDGEEVALAHSRPSLRVVIGSNGT